ncbi:glycosyltransferase family 4 protein [Komarekiella sp. 'clone 1']|uniref:Glycosyltransferase family 4 protein n=1 Tax=Komarekiella delphini-convector SJRDD-AB1 TaxID=2593771 RepID=A0AA40VTA8_9NOST|nr:glycosyltransferase family 4 protein [Komarekiella delphini-convector]MBD6618271.1 glycosyltransferase family 4 protein [Komarekiella delphini-convector SJRDD-AB1]
MQKILHLIHSFNRGGIEKWLLSMLQEIPRNKCEMDFCCKGEDIGTLAAIAQSDAKLFHCPLGLGHFGFVQGLKRILVEGQYHILHNHSETYSGIAVWVAKQLGIPVITSFHNTSFSPQTTITRLPIVRRLRSIYGMLSIGYALRHSDLLTGCSQGVIQSLGQGTKIKQLPQVLYYGVSQPPLATSQEYTAFRNSFGWSDETPIILHVGRLIEQKNHLGVLSVFKLVLEHIPTTKLLLVGEGPLRSLIEDAIANWGLTKSVLLLGERDDVPSLMSRSDVFFLPSLHEGLPVVALEASAASLPIVGSKIPGLLEAVRDGETALLHDIDDIQGMAKSLVKLISDRTYNDQLGQAGQRWVKNQYSTATSAHQLLEAYKSLM